MKTGIIDSRSYQNVRPLCDRPAFIINHRHPRTTNCSRLVSITKCLRCMANVVKLNSISRVVNLGTLALYFFHRVSIASFI